MAFPFLHSLNPSWSNRGWFWGILLWIVLILIPLTYHIEKMPIRLWDESRLTTNALEMYENGFSIITTFNGEPDLWNTKPPLMIWLQWLGLHLFGLREWAIRWPSVFAAIAMCLLLVRFTYKHLQNAGIGAMAALFLVSFNGFVELHVSRTGDYDTLLTLWLFAANLTFFEWIHHQKKTSLILFFLSLTLAVFTKGITGFLFGPFWFLILVIHPNRTQMLSQPVLWIGALGSLAMVAAFYGFREATAPGYLEAIRNNELGGRFLQVNEGHEGSITFYLSLLLENQITYFIPWLFPALWMAFTIKDKNERSFMRYLLMAMLWFLLIISISKTKLNWYNAPIYPLLALFLALGLHSFFSHLYARFKLTIFAKPWICLICISLIPYTNVVRKVWLCEEVFYEKPLHATGWFLKEKRAEDPESMAQWKYLSSQDYEPQINLYKMQWSAMRKPIQTVKIDQLQIGDTLFSDYDRLDTLSIPLLHVRKIDVNRGIFIYTIDEKL